MSRLRIPAAGVGSLLLLALLSASAQATFSIVAVDPATGEVGGAGASCIPNSIIINDLIEGVGAIHTQAYWNITNKTRAHDRMIAGDSPQEIINYVIANDAGGFGCPGGPCNSTHRQYGVVDLFGGGARSAAFTGSGTTAYAGDITGPTYAIQGNILLDPVTQYDVLGEMETAFLGTSGPLADRLMAALQAANVAGADTRCLADGKPAISAFIRVVRIGDGPTPYLDLNIGNTLPGDNPITLLQSAFDAWKSALAGEPDPFLSSVTVADTSIVADGSSQTTVTVIPRDNGGVDLGTGQVVTIATAGTGTMGPVTDNLDGTYTGVLTASWQVGTDTITATVLGSGGPVTLGDQPTVQFTPVPGEPDPALSSVTVSPDLLPADGNSQAVITVVPRNASGSVLSAGRLVSVSNSGLGVLGLVVDNLDGSYVATLTAPSRGGTDGITATVDGSGGPVLLDDQPSVRYRGSGSSGGGCIGIIGGGDPGSDLGAILPYLILVLFLLSLRARSARLRSA